MSHEKEYEVGYKRAPKASQFPKGVSGNPNGRPKNMKQSVADIFQAEMNKKISAIIAGRKISITQMEAFIRNLIKKIIQDRDMKAAKILFGLDERKKKGKPIGQRTINDALNEVTEYYYDEKS